MSRRNPPSNPFSLFSFQDIITATTGILILLALVLALSVVAQNSHATPTPDPNGLSAELERQLENLEAEVAQLQLQDARLPSDAQLAGGLSAGELRNMRESLQSSIAVLKTQIGNLSTDADSLETTVKTEQQEPRFVSNASELAELQRKVAETREEIERLKQENRVIYNFRQTSSPPWLVELGSQQILCAKAGEKQQPKKFANAGELIRFAQGLDSSERYFVLFVKPDGIDLFNRIKSELEKAGADIGIELIAREVTVIDALNGAGF